MKCFNEKNFSTLFIEINIFLVLSFPLVGNPSGVMLKTRQHSKAKKDSGQAGMTS